MTIKIFKSNRATKKYKAIISKGGKKIKTVHFGGVRKNGTPYPQFKDKTPLKAYSKYDHNDTKRKKAYYARHGAATLHSAKWFSHKYLW